jgi:hypothetical protein
MNIMKPVDETGLSFARNNGTEHRYFAEPPANVRNNGTEHRYIAENHANVRNNGTEHRYYLPRESVPAYF